MTEQQTPPHQSLTEPLLWISRTAFSRDSEEDDDIEQQKGGAWRWIYHQGYRTFSGIDPCDPGILKLPRDIWVHVTSLLPLNDILRLALVNRSFRYFYYCPKLWHELLRRDFNVCLSQTPSVNLRYRVREIDVYNRTDEQDEDPPEEEEEEKLFLETRRRPPGSILAPLRGQDAEFQNFTRNNFYFKTYREKFRERIKRLHAITEWRNALRKYVGKIGCCMWSRILGDIHQHCCVPCALACLPLTSLVLFCYKMDNQDIFGWLTVLLPLLTLLTLIVSGFVQSLLCRTFRLLPEAPLFPFGPLSGNARMRTLHWQAEMKSLCGDFTRRAFERPLSMVLHVFSFLCTSTAFILLFLKMGALKETKWTYALIPTFVAWISVPSSIIVNYHDNQRISMIRSFLLKMGGFYFPVLLTGLLLSLKVDGIIDMATVYLMMPIFVAILIEVTMRQIWIIVKCKQLVRDGRPLWTIILTAIPVTVGAYVGVIARYSQMLLIVLKLDSEFLEEANWFKVFVPGLIMLIVSLFGVIGVQCVFCSLRGRNDLFLGGYGFFSEVFLQYILTQQELNHTTEH